MQRNYVRVLLIIEAMYFKILEPLTKELPEIAYHKIR